MQKSISSNQGHVSNFILMRRWITKRIWESCRCDAQRMVRACCCVHSWSIQKVRSGNGYRQVGLCAYKKPQNHIFSWIADGSFLVVVFWK